MKRKSILFSVSVLLIVLVMGVLSACTKSKNKNMLIMGDSIAESVIGPSPITERYNYGYYGLLDQCNSNINVYNAAVSGHESGHLVDLLNGNLPSYTRNGEIYKVPNSRNYIQRVKDADLMHVSIFGNDLLGPHMNEILKNFIEAEALGKIGLGQAITDKTDNESVSNKLAEISTKFNEIMYTSEDTEKTSLWKGNVSKNAKKLVEKLIELKKKNSKVIFQKIYNPIIEGTNLVSKEVKETLKSKKGLDFDTKEGRAYLRKITAEMIRILFLPLENEIKGKSDFMTIDPQEHFNKLVGDDESRFKDLIFPDYVHPSNEGHSQLFVLTQETLRKEGIITAKEYKASLKKYKKILTNQYARLYGRDTKISKKINKAASLSDASRIYFAEIKGKVPKLPKNY